MNLSLNSYFFYVLSALVLIGLVNGLFFLPILLSLVGPPAELIPADGEDRIAPPTPEPSPCMERCSRGRHGESTGGSSKMHNNSSSSNNNNSNNNNCSNVPRRLRGSDLSLTTITEEPPSWTSSHEIVVQPEVVVETTTWNGDGTCNSRHSSDQVTIRTARISFQLFLFYFKNYYSLKKNVILIHFDWF